MIFLFLNFKEDVDVTKAPVSDLRNLLYSPDINEGVSKDGADVEALDKSSVDDSEPAASKKGVY